MPVIIFKYLSKQVIQVLLAISSIVLLILMSGRFVRYLTQAADGTLKASFLMLIMAYRIPEFLEMIIPLGLFLGIILVYGRLYVDNEMSVLRACGVSQNQLLQLTTGPALLVMLVVAFISFYLSPAGIQKVDRILAQQDALTVFDTITPGRFQVVGAKGQTTYMESLSSDKKTMENVFIANHSASNEKTGSISLILANHAQIARREGDARYLMLYHGYRYDLTPGLPEIRAIQYNSYGLKMPEHNAPEKVVQEKALPTKKLWGSDNPAHIAELQWRISLVLLIPIITLLAIPLAKINPRQGRFIKLLPALLLYLFYIMILISCRGAIADGLLSSFWGIWWVHIVYLFLALGAYFYEPVRFKLASRRMTGA